MGFDKIRSIKVSERVFSIVCEELDLQATEYGVKISGYLECFNNCREQGYILHVDSVDWKNENRTKTDLFIWVCEQRNSDCIMVIWSNQYPGSKGMFSEEDYNTRRTFFKYGEYQQAANYIIEKVKETFAKEFKK